MTTTATRPAGPRINTIGPFVGAGLGLLVLLAAVAIYGAITWGRRIAGQPSTGGFTETLRELVRGRVEWPAAATWILVGFGVVLAALVIGIVVLTRLGRSGRSRVDAAAGQMGRGKDISMVTRAHAEQKAADLGAAGTIGMTLGESVADHTALASSPEDVGVLLAGPRTMKTTCYAIPALVDAPGAALAGGNKRDIVDATRDLRALKGATWVYDPQNLAGEEPSWWWNPLSMINDLTDARELARMFAAYDVDPGSKRDPQFDGTGESLLATLLLAAARGGRPISDVYGWCTDPTDDEPLTILEQVGGETMSVKQLEKWTTNTPAREQSGYYSTAMRMADVLTYQKLWPWITDDGTGRPEFSPAEFAKSTDTLYLLSEEGKGSAGPIVTALTAAVIEAAREQARNSPGGRLPVHLTAILDEVANTCRWKELPSLYSYLGSQGVTALAILQSYAQGESVWGEAGMKKLWSFANFKLYGGGISETGFLKDLSELIGDWDRPSQSESWSDGRRTVSRDTRRERILDVAQLHALPRRRAVLMASGSVPTLVRTQPWTERPDADFIAASIRRHDPQATATLTDVTASVEAEKASETGELAG